MTMMYAQNAVDLTDGDVLSVVDLTDGDDVTAVGGFGEGWVVVCAMLGDAMVGSGDGCIISPSFTLNDLLPIYAQTHP